MTPDFFCFKEIQIADILQVTVRSTACGRTAQTVHSTTDMKVVVSNISYFRFIWARFPIWHFFFSDGWKSPTTLCVILFLYLHSFEIRLFVHVFSRRESRREILSVSNFEVETSGNFGLEVFVLPVLPPKSLHSPKLTAKSSRVTFTLPETSSKSPCQLMVGRFIHFPFGMVCLFRCYVFSC